MKKKVFLLCGAGALFGVALSTIITILISLTAGDGHFYAVVPELIADCGGELNAVMLQTALSMLYGAAWAGAALIWRRDGWSLTKQTALHLLVCSAATFPIAWACRWMRHDAAGAALYFGVFFAIYAHWGNLGMGQYLGKRRLGKGTRGGAKGGAKKRGRLWGRPRGFYKRQ